MADAKELYDLAGHAVRRNEYDKAIAYFTKSLRMEPDFVEARRALRGLLRSISQGKKGNFFTAPGLMFKLKMAETRKNAPEGFKLAEQYLLKDPDSTWAIQLLARFAKVLGHTKTACFAYQCLAELSPDDPKKVFEAADFISDMGDLESHEVANQLMQHLAKKYANNPEITSQQNSIASKKLLAAYQNAEKTSDVMADSSKAKELEKESQEIRTDQDMIDAIERARKRDKDEPNNARHKETLATLLFRKGELKEAVSIFRDAIELDGNNNKLRDLLGDVEIKSVEDFIEKAKRRIKKATGEELVSVKEKLLQARKKLNSTRLNEFKRRIKVNPNDLSSRFQLGMLYFSVKKYDEAITQLQKSVSDPRLAFQSAKTLGYSFREKGLHDLAITQFKEAANRTSLNQVDKLDSQYEIALCYEFLGEKQEALDIFKSILEKDYGFRDVNARIAKLKS